MIDVSNEWEVKYPFPVGIFDQHGPEKPQPIDTKAMYYVHMGTDNVYGQNVEIVAISKLSHLSAEIHIKLTNQQRKECVIISAGTAERCLLLCTGHIDCGHYDVLLPITEKTKVGE